MKKGKKYEKSLKNTEPISLSPLSNIAVDLRDIMKYAKEKNMQVYELAEEEKNRFITRKDIE